MTRGKQELFGMNEGQHRKGEARGDSVIQVKRSVSQPGLAIPGLKAQCCSLVVGRTTVFLMWRLLFPDLYKWQL